MYNDTDPNGLTDDEIGSILTYKSGESYTLNAKLREGIELDKYEQETVNNLDKALEKLPTYKGKVYRDIQKDTATILKMKSYSLATQDLRLITLYMMRKARLQSI